MWRNNPTSESARLGQYWDSVVSGRPNVLEIVVDPSLAATISHLDRVDDSRPASSQFSRRFEMEFLSAIGAVETQTAPLSGRIDSKPNQGQQQRKDGSLIDFRRFSTSRRATLLAVAAALLVFIAAAAAISLVRERNAESPVASDSSFIPAPSTNFGVPMDRGDAARSGVMPGPGVSNNLAMRWNFDVGQGGISAPAMVGESIFVTGGPEVAGGAENSGSVIAIDASNGDERWRVPTEHAASGTPSIVDGFVYASDMGGTIYSLDAESGEQIWRTDLASGWASTPLAVGETLYVAVAPYRVSLHLAMQHGTIVVGSGLVGGASEAVQLYALDRESGEERWHASDVLSGVPGLFAFDAATGALDWSFEMASLESGPAISGQQVFAGSTLDATMYAIDLGSGAENWRTDIGEDLPQDASPAVGDGKVFVTTAFGQIVCLDAQTGDELWRANAEHVSLNSSAIVVDDSLFVVDTAFGVSAFSTEDGAVLWSEQLELTGQVVDSPIVSNGNLFIVTSLEGEAGHVARLWVFVGTEGDGSEASRSP